MLDSLALFNGLGQQLRNLNLKQRVISQNVANADTPGYLAHRVSAPNFSKTMERYMKRSSLSGSEKVLPQKTSPMHMTEKLSVGRAPAGQETKESYEIAPSENGVVLEEEMMKGTQIAGQHQLMLNIYRRNQALINSAMRRTQ